ncbi:hypothetical protein JQU17_09150 [Ponticoccus sp. SC2-23]|uniref:hypothetical protein n=1 Tax=Alexandriicola marinus TaxID=2081710 RepID=UPI000FD81C0B|nr:hypothetical protein [Alexandriicola marinus]MBM1220147.1 hypothetical protein [Ponticoccus sp. SC6-9]MBM1224833.1 hypothetical protein [Ponticoccus sp. SC6-15]MBM1228347.1 hypothetical protein [Ponticoccus sp. SC6-38]MBM1234016.1 hypothetical protein [Ponticoccus sp. SC6-45]MBM1238848.1 hypothetical protein [Ponticoccus sp. SC6-49]MBM1242630.1 hypothetical protein [Ponticoccus sp. SC2-64]MBM1247540.1 hypothetical protein [Ponticoccus sp. SC6-42]MBM1251801.1 hypothetical protein [Pontico
MIARAARLALRTVPTGLSVLILVWVISTNPFARPIADATTDQVMRSLDLAMQGTVTGDWFDRELALALDAKDLDRVDIVTISATGQGIAPTPEQARAIDALRAEEGGFLAQSRDCLICMADIEECPSVRLIAICAIPFELTPGGDINALRRVAVDYAAGEDVDRIELSLALVGLGATSLVIATGGSSLTIKAGATVLRLGRKLGSLSPAFLARLRDLADIPVRVSAVPGLIWGTRTLDDVTDTARLAALGAVAADIGHVASQTSLSDTILLLRHVDTPGDATRLAKLADAAGPETRQIVDVIGPGRAMRATLRLADEAIGAAVALWLAAGQLLASLGAMLARPLLRRMIRP